MKPRSSLLAGAAALALSLPLWAQNTPATGSAHGERHNSAQGAHGHRAPTMERMKAGHERRLQELKVKLQLSADQEPAWAAFA